MKYPILGMPTPILRNEFWIGTVTRRTARALNVWDLDVQLLSSLDKYAGAIGNTSWDATRAKGPAFVATCYRYLISNVPQPRP